MNHIFLAATAITTQLLLGLQVGCSKTNQMTTLECRISIDNPRKVGKHYYASTTTDGEELGESPEKSSTFQIEKWEYRVEIGLLVKLRSGQIVVPQYVDRSPRFGMCGRLEYVDMPAKPQREVSRSMQEFLLPFSPEYSTYILLMRNAEDRTGIRCLELDAARARDTMHVIDVPDLKQLPLVETRPDGTALLRTLSEAIREHNERIRANPDATPGDLVTGKTWL